MAVYSHSRIGCFEQCPLKFKFNYIDKVKTEIEATVEAFLGSRVHDVLEKLYADLKFQKLNTLQELLDFFNSEWEKNWNDAILIVREQYSQENFKKMGIKFITDYYNRYKPFNQAKTLGLETQNFLELDDNYKIHVRIDRLALTQDNVYEIHDYKTSNSLPTQESLDQDRQLAIYAYGVKKMYPDAKKIKLIWHYLAFDKEMISQRTDEQLQNVKKEVIKLIKQIESSNDFPARESALCKWCQFVPICPNFKHSYELEKKPPNEYLKDGGVKLVNRYSEIYEKIKKDEKELEKIKESLMNHAKKENIEVVYGSDVKVSIKEYPKLSFPKKNDSRQKEFFDTIKKIGLWDQFAVVDVYELTKKINNNEIHEELLNLLDRFIHKEKITRVSLRKK